MSHPYMARDCRLRRLLGVLRSAANTPDEITTLFMQCVGWDEPANPKKTIRPTMQITMPLPLNQMAKRHSVESLACPAM